MERNEDKVLFKNVFVINWTEKVLVVRFMYFLEREKKRKIQDFFNFSGEAKKLSVGLSFDFTLKYYKMKIEIIP